MNDGSIESRMVRIEEKLDALLERMKYGDVKFKEYDQRIREMEMQIERIVTRMEHSNKVLVPLYAAGASGLIAWFIRTFMG
jgi:hypothetical protein